MTDRDAKRELVRRANGIDATVRVGKGGVDEDLIGEVALQLKKRRLIKVKVLRNAGSDAGEVASKLAEATGSAVVDVRGGAIVLADKRTWNSLRQKRFRGSPGEWVCWTWMSSGPIRRGSGGCWFTGTGTPPSSTGCSRRTPGGGRSPPRTTG
ncbi:YhbY family RNA-binding protein [Methanomassiliicoccaceae archaeon COG_1]|nr:YhbY family RNA-binding protein [Methanomassiliicoccaceae archaeon COG_1]